MPLRAVCWLLLAVVAGSAIGFSVGLRGADSASLSAASPTPEDPAPFTFAPPGGRRPVQPHGLYTGPTTTPGLQPLSGVEAESLTLTDAGDAAVAPDAAPAPYARELSFLALPSGAVMSTPGTPTETTTTTTTTTTTPTAPTPAPTGPPPKIDGVHTSALTALSATLSWRTSESASSRVVYGLDAPVVWTAPTATGTTHVATVTGLTPSSSYKLDVTATTPDGRSSVAQFMLTTPSLAGTPVRASTGNGAVLLNGQPSFPKMVWFQCPDGIGPSLAAGIDTFMGNACGSGAQLANWLAGSALVIADARDSAADRSGSIGTHLPDEWDTFLPNDFSLADALKTVPMSPGSGPRFLTLTNHFYSRAAPLPQGRGMYPGLAASADVLGFDLYPLQNWCRYDSFGDVFDSQVDLVALARGKPTYQWIEVRGFDCKAAELDPTPQTVRAESWLSVAGGAHAIGYFPNNWSAVVGAEIARLNHEFSTLAPALVAPTIASSATLGSPIKVGAREHNGAVYVIAVNSSRAPANATITVPALVDRTLVTLDAQHKAKADGGSFSASFAPLEARVYIAAPSS